MNIQEDVAVWAATRPEWQQNVLARLCRNEVIDDGAIEQIATALIVGGSLPINPITTADVLGVAVSSKAVRLNNLRDLDGINALAPAQKLTFAPVGLTVIYGDNASGKSGYARLLRNAVAARVPSDLLGNVFVAPTSSDQQAVIEFAVDNIDEVWEWKPHQPTSPALAQVHYYDKECGDAYISTASEISYRPSALTLFDRLASVCVRVNAALDEKLRANVDGKPALPVVAEGTKAAAFLASVGASTSIDQIDVATKREENADAELSRLLSEEVRLNASDPEKERQLLTAKSDNLLIVANHCDRLADALTESAINDLNERRTNARELRNAALVFSKKHFGADPVSGVGTQTWRTLWSAAQAFSESEAYRGLDFPVTDEHGRCVLCQQTLEVESAQRLRRFGEMMTDTIERDALIAQHSLEEARDSLTVVQESPTAVLLSVNELRTAGEVVAGPVDDWLSHSIGEIAATLKWLDGETDRSPSPILNNPATNLRIRSGELCRQAQGIDSTSFDLTRQDVSRRIDEMRATAELADCKPIIGQEIRRLSERRKIEAAKHLSDTTGITRKSVDLTKDYVTELVRVQFADETKRLKLDVVTLAPTSGHRGTLPHLPILVGTTSETAVVKVLSEGEKTACGLAGFITEVESDVTKSAVIFDDPVTSLDHTRRSIVAKRLVALATERQIIIFTHDVMFVGDLIKHAGEANVEVARRSVYRQGAQVGFCSENHPWKAKDVAARIGNLKAELARIGSSQATFSQDEYDEACGGWAGKLSETWERAVNLEIINEVVDRGTSQVMPRKFRILVAITETDGKEFQAGYSKASEWARRHDKDPEVNFVAPQPDDMAAELTRLEEWYKRVKDYRS